jgi:hypothetical protein
MRPAVRGRDRMRKWFTGGTLEKSEKNAAAGPDATGKLVKNRWYLGRREVDQGIPGEDAGQMAIRDWQRAERRHSKLCRWKPPSRLFDEEGNEVDALRLDAVVREKCCPVSGA